MHEPRIRPARRRAARQQLFEVWPDARLRYRHARRVLLATLVGLAAMPTVTLVGVVAGWPSTTLHVAVAVTGTAHLATWWWLRGPSARGHAHVLIAVATAVRSLADADDPAGRAAHLRTSGFDAALATARRSDARLRAAGGPTVPPLA